MNNIQNEELMYDIWNVPPNQEQQFFGCHVLFPFLISSINYTVTYT